MGWQEKIQGNFGQSHISNNKDVVLQDHHDHDNAFKVRCLIDYINDSFLSSMEPEVKQSVEDHIIKYKGIIWQHIENKPIKWGFKMWYRCAPKTCYLYEFDIYNVRKETTEFVLGESAMLHLTEKINGYFFCIFFWQFFHFVVAHEKIDWQLIVWDRGCSTKPKAVTKDWKTNKEEKKQKKQQKLKELAHESLFTSEESFNCGDRWLLCEQRWACRFTMEGFKSCNAFDKLHWSFKSRATFKNEHQKH